MFSCSIRPLDGWMDVFPDFTCRIFPYSCSSIPSSMSAVLSLAVTLSTRNPGETLPSPVLLASTGSAARLFFLHPKVLGVSRDAFVSSPLPVPLDFGLFVSAGRVWEAFLHPALAPVFAPWDSDSQLAWVDEKLPFGVKELPEWAAGLTWKQQAAFLGMYPEQYLPALTPITELLWWFPAKSLAKWSQVHNANYAHLIQAQLW